MPKLRPCSTKKVNQPTSETKYIEIKTLFRQTIISFHYICQPITIHLSRFTTMLDQRIIDLFDQFTHGVITRQEFMRRLTVFAGSAVGATSVLSKLQLDYTNADTTAYAADEIETKYVEYDSGSATIRAYLATPKKKKKRAGVVVIHENRGLNPHIEDVTRRVALAGFTALAPDGLSPLGGTPADADAARELIGKLEQPVAIQLFKDGLKYLRELPKASGKTGCVGFCWGGAMANNLAVNDPNLNAAVAFYGRQAAAEDVPKIKAALLLHYGALDERVNAGIPAYEAALKQHNKNYQLYIYEGANHAFHNDTAGPRYDEKAAKLAWGRTMEFFEEKLK